MRNCWTATSYAEYHRNGCTHAAYSPGCRPLGSHSRLATTPSTMPRRLHRYKTLPARAPRGRYRYKTLPARPKYLFSAHFAPAGRTLYRFHHHQAEQGEFSTAYGTTYGTKLSRHAPPSAQPVQNSPSTPENADFGPLSARRENLFTLTPITSHAGRTLYRTRGLCRYKTLPTRPKTPILAHFPHAGRVLYRFHHHQAEQGEKSHARAAPRGAGQALTTPGTP